MIVLSNVSGNTEYVSDITCVNSVCQPNISGVANACAYICGNETCPWRMWSTAMKKEDVHT